MNDAAELLAELVQREPIFHQKAFGSTHADFTAMTAEDFWEVGASGTMYQRSEVLDLLEARHADNMIDGPLQASEFVCRRLGSDAFLLTYHLVQDGTRHTRRATIWERDGGQWRIVYHQGTIVAASAA